MSSRKFLDKSLEIGTEDLLRQVLPKLKWSTGRLLGRKLLLAQLNVKSALLASGLFYDVLGPKLCSSPLSLDVVMLSFDSQLTHRAQQMTK